MQEELTPESPSYWSAFNMERDPFSGEVEGLYFPGGDRGDLLNTALDIVKANPLPVVFYGPQGIGKTTLLHALANAVADDVLVLKLRPGFMDSPEKIFAEIAQALDMPSINFIPSAFCEQVVETLDTDQKLPDSVLLLVDDADELKDDTLHSLRQLAATDSMQLRLLLFASSDGNGLLRPELDRSDVQRVEVQAIAREDLRPYLEYRLSTAGFDGDFPLTDADLDSIFNQSLGIPARIGRLAEQKLRHKTRLSQLVSADESVEKKRGLPLLHKILIAVLLILIAAVLLLGRDDGAPEPNETEFYPEHSSIDPEGEGSATQNGADEQAPTSDGQDEADSSDMGSGTDTDNDTETDTDTGAGLPTLPAPVAEPIEESLDGSAQPAEEPAEPSSRQSDPLLDVTEADEPVSAEPAAENAQDTPPEQAAAPDLPPAEAVQIIDKSEPLASDSLGLGLSDDERALLASEPSFFTLQLISSASKAGMDDFARRYAKQGVRYYRRRSAGKELFVAVVGEYSSREQARSAMAALPVKLRKSSPWPRTLSSVQDEIRSAQ